MAQVRRGARRRHSAELKARVLAECAVPGASVAAVALSHRLNANLVHRWRRIAEGREHGRRGVQRVEEFVALPMAAVPAVVASEEISIEVRRAGWVVSVRWPVSAAAHSAVWLRELLR